MRSRNIPTRIVTPDIIYNDSMAGKFINFLMKKGDKKKATNTFYNALNIIEAKTKRNGYQIFQQALDKTTPVVELKSRRMGGATHQIPIEARPARKIYLRSKWLIASAKKRNEKSMSERLAHELIAASKGEGNAIKKKIDMYKMAQSNKSFSHLKF